MHRMSHAFCDKKWDVKLIGILKKSSLECKDDRIIIERLRVYPESGWLFYTLMNWRFFWKAISSKSNYYLSVDLDTLPALRLASLIKGKPLIWDCHEIYTQIPELYSRPLVKQIWVNLERFFTPNLKRVIAVTGGVALYLKRFNVDPMVIHNYPRYRELVVFFTQKIQSKTILFQGFLNEGRCLDILVKSISFIPEPYCLEIIGDGVLKEELENLVKSEKLGARIRFTGLVTPEELVKKTESAFIGISLLDREHGNSMVSLANKNLDYIMARLPGVTMDFHEYRSINEKWPVAILLEMASPETVSKAINRLIADPELYKNMVIACEAASQVLNWENESQKLYEIIDSL